MPPSAVEIDEWRTQVRLQCQCRRPWPRRSEVRPHAPAGPTTHPAEPPDPLNW